MSDETTESNSPPAMPPEQVQAAPPQMPQISGASIPNLPMVPPLTVNPYEVSQDDQTMGMLVHLLSILTGIIGVLIIWLVKKDQSRFVDHHGKDALNFQLTLMLVSFTMVALGFLTLGVGLIVAIPLLWVMGIVALVLEIMACMAANRGEWYTYPMTIRFIK